MKSSENILIITGDNDVHAEAVIWGLRQFGLDPVIFDRLKFPSAMSMIWTPEHGRAVSFAEDNGKVHMSPFDVIWCRRLSPPPTPRASSHPDDLQIIIKESTTYLDSIVPFLGHENTFWVNPYFSSRIAERKMAQLVAAQKIGFQIPDTLMGNDYASILAFFKKHMGRIIHKPHSPGGWGNEDGSSTVLKTARVLEEHLSDKESILACPGIYQELIEKKWEYRVTIMGDRIFAGIIDSQSDGESIDWRYDGKIGAVPYRSVTLPKKLSDLCISFCKEMNLRFACIDLIHGKNDEIVFLEANQAGQFLWIEDIDSQSAMLDGFCRFLLEGAAFPVKKMETIRFAEFRSSVKHADVLPLPQ